jgi:GNAT superfamily N-acetyltransferase
MATGFSMKLPRSLVHRLIRRKAGLGSIPVGKFRVSVACTARDYEGAFRLVQAAYVAAGIESTDSPALRVFEHHLLREATVFVAYEGEQLVGTITLLEDSAAGLLLDRDYPREMAELRAHAEHVSEICALTVVKRCRHQGVAQLLSMTATRYAAVHRKVSHIVIGVHPRAEDYYGALWGMHCFGAPRAHAALVAPVMGIAVSIADLREHLVRYGSHRLASGRSAVEHVFGATSFPGVDLPEVHGDELTRWKMPRHVFRRLFMEDTHLAQELSPVVRREVERQRSRSTLMSDEVSISEQQAVSMLLAVGGRP